MILILRKQGQGWLHALLYPDIALGSFSTGTWRNIAAETKEASGELEQVSAMQSPIHAPAQPKSKSSKRIRLFIERN